MAFTNSGDAGGFSLATRFRSSGGIDAGPWQALTLAEGWDEGSYVEYRRLGEDILQFKGSLSRSINAHTFWPVGTLPLEFRPSSQQGAICYAQNQINTPLSSFVTILVSGDIFAGALEQDIAMIVPTAILSLG